SVIATNELSTDVLWDLADEIFPGIQTVTRFADVKAIKEELIVVATQENAGNNPQISARNVEYLSKDQFGKDITLSGVIYTNNTDWEKNQFKGIVLANHYTITANNEAPSQTFQYDAWFALKGYVVVMPDYIGFGKTKDKPQTYLHSESTARASLDLFKATQKYLEANGKKTSGSNYNLGYSQGGAVSIAVLSKASKESISFTKTYAGAGPYSPEKTFHEIMGKNTIALPAAVPLIVIGMDASYDLNLDYTKVFKEPLVSNYQGWVNSKEFTTAEINQKIGTTTISEILTANMFDENNAQRKILVEKLRDNELSGSWISNLKGEKKINVFLFHSTSDDVVPYINSELMSGWLEDTSTVDLTKKFGNFGSHLAGGSAFYLNVFLDLGL
ncbi:MAG: lipase family protein, partial [Treponemataceae bacterium]